MYAFGTNKKINKIRLFLCYEADSHFLKIFKDLKDYPIKSYVEE